MLAPRIALCLALFAAEGAAAPSSPPPKPKAPVQTTSVELTWSIHRDGQRLVVDYTAKNTSQATVWLADQLPVPGSKKPYALGADRIIVMPDPDDPDIVLLVRARVKSTTPLPRLLDPGTRELAPGASLTGHAVVPLPLTAWHYRGNVAPIKGTPTRVQLRIGVLAGTPHLAPLELEDGSHLTISHPSDPMSAVRSDIRALP